MYPPNPYQSNEEVRNDTITVTTATQVISNQVMIGQRRALVITNTSGGGQIISLAWGAEAVANSGIVLYPGGAWSESIDSAFIPSNLRISAISSAAGGSIAIQERVG